MNFIQEQEIFVIKTYQNKQKELNSKLSDALKSQVYWDPLYCDFCTAYAYYYYRKTLVLNGYAASQALRAFTFKCETSLTLIRTCDMFTTKE